MLLQCTTQNKQIFENTLAYHSTVKIKSERFYNTAPYDMLTTEKGKGVVLHNKTFLLGATVYSMAIKIG